MIEPGIIRIRNAVFYAYHGVKEDEQNLGGKFELDAELTFDMAAAAETDQLRRTVDYEKAYDHIRQVVTSQKYYLLEALAEKIAEVLMRQFPALDVVTVRVRKPHPPVKGVVDHIEVEITRRR
jgi:dihydroneopterin aldolase